MFRFRPTQHDDGTTIRTLRHQYDSRPFFSVHFPHLFHRLRIAFLDAYQSLVLSEPDSAVNQPLKEAFLTLRQAAESDE